MELKKNYGYKRLQIALNITVRKQNNLLRRKKFKAQRTTKNRQNKADDLINSTILNYWKFFVFLTILYKKLVIGCEFYFASIHCILFYAHVSRQREKLSRNLSLLSKAKQSKGQAVNS